MRDKGRHMTIGDCVEALLGHAKAGVIPSQHMIDEIDHILKQHEDQQIKKTEKRRELAAERKAGVPFSEIGV